MDILEMLDACKTKLGLKSDYALAKVFEIRPVRMSAYRRGKEHPDVYVCFKIAEILEISPAKVIAQVEAVTTKNPAKALFFQRYFSIAGLWIVLGFASLVYSPHSEAAFAHGITSNAVTIQGVSRVIIAHYAKQKRLQD